MGDILFEDLRSRFSGLRGPNFVKELIEVLGQLQGALVDLRRDIEVIQDYNLLSHRLELVSGRRKPPIDLPHTVEISAMEHLLARDGFYALEYADDGTAFRWTGPERTFTFSFYVDRNRPLQLTLDSLSNLQTVEAFVDGLPLRSQVQPQGAGYRLLATLEPRESAEATQLIFVIPSVSVPRDSEDRRLLGIAFCRLSVSRMHVPGLELTNGPDRWSREAKRTRHNARTVKKKKKEGGRKAAARKTGYAVVKTKSAERES